MGRVMRSTYARNGVTWIEQRKRAMSTMIPAEMMGGAVQMFVYLVTAVAAFLGYFVTART